MLQKQLHISVGKWFPDACIQSVNHHGNDGNCVIISFLLMDFFAHLTVRTWSGWKRYSKSLIQILAYCGAMQVPLIWRNRLLPKLKWLWVRTKAQFGGKVSCIVARNNISYGIHFIVGCWHKDIPHPWWLKWSPLAGWSRIAFSTKSIWCHRHRLEC